MATLAQLLNPTVYAAMQADPNAAQRLAPVKGARAQPDYIGLNMGDGATPETGISPWLTAGMNDPAAYQKRLYQEGEFSDPERWAPGAEAAILRNATYDPKYGLMYDVKDAEQYWIPREYGAFSNFMEKAIPMVAGGLMIGGATGLIGTGGEAAAAGASEAAAGAGAAEAGGYGAGLADLGGSVGADITGGMMTGAGGGAIDLGAAGTMGGAGTLGTGGVTMAEIGQVAAASGLSMADALSAIKTAGQALSSGMNLKDILSVAGPAAGVISSIYGAKVNQDAIDKASQTQQAGQDAALAEMKRQFDIGQGNMQPWLTSGKNALSQLDTLLAPGGELTQRFDLSKFQQDPGYQFQLEQGEQGVNRAAAARGGYDSGRTLKELLRYDNGLASQSYGDAYNRYNTDQTNRFNRLASISGLGQTTANTLANNGANYGTNVANTVTGGANAQAASQIAGANARTSGYTGVANAIMGGINNYQNQQMLSDLLKRYGS